MADRSTSDRLQNRGGVRAATGLAESRSVSALHIPALLVGSAAILKRKYYRYSGSWMSLSAAVHPMISKECPGSASGSNTGNDHRQ